MDVRDALGRENAKVGDKLEVTLLEGAEYFNGCTEAPTVDLAGYDPPEQQTETPGMKVIGYLDEVQNDRVVMRAGTGGKRPRDNYEVAGAWYVHQDAVHSIEVQRARGDQRNSSIDICV